MATRLINGLIPLKHAFSRSAVAAKPALSGGGEAVPKGFLAVYVGECSQEKKRYLIPVSYVNKPQFQQLLHKAESEFGYHHPMGGLTIPCREEVFLHVTSSLHC